MTFQDGKTVEMQVSCATFSLPAAEDICLPCLTDVSSRYELRAKRLNASMWKLRYAWLRAEVGIYLGGDEGAERVNQAIDYIDQYLDKDEIQGDTIVDAEVLSMYRGPLAGRALGRLPDRQEITGIRIGIAGLLRKLTTGQYPFPNIGRMAETLGLYIQSQDGLSDGHFGWPGSSREEQHSWRRRQHHDAYILVPEGTIMGRGKVPIQMKQTFIRQADYDVPCIGLEEDLGLPIENGFGLQQLAELAVRHCEGETNEQEDHLMAGYTSAYVTAIERCVQMWPTLRLKNPAPICPIDNVRKIF